MMAFESRLFAISRCLILKGNAASSNSWNGRGTWSLVLQQFSGFWVGADIILPAVTGSSILWFQGKFRSVGLGWFLTSVTWLYGITAASNSWNGGTWSLALQQFSSFSIGAAMIFSQVLKTLTQIPGAAISVSRGRWVSNA